MCLGFQARQRGRLAAPVGSCIAHQLSWRLPQQGRPPRSDLSLEGVEEILEAKRLDPGAAQLRQRDIWKGICEARIIIADLSTANPNVAYEVGLADVLGKRMILLAQKPEKVPFDFAGVRLLAYQPDRLDALESLLVKRIEQLLR